MTMKTMKIKIIQIIKKNLFFYLVLLFSLALIFFIYFFFPNKKIIYIFINIVFYYILYAKIVTLILNFLAYNYTDVILQFAYRYPIFYHLLHFFLLIFSNLIIKQLLLSITVISLSNFFYNFSQILNNVQPPPVNEINETTTICNIQSILIYSIDEEDKKKLNLSMHLHLQILSSIIENHVNLIIQVVEREFTADKLKPFHELIVKYKDFSYLHGLLSIIVQTHNDFQNDCTYDAAGEYDEACLLLSERIIKMTNNFTKIVDILDLFKQECFSLQKQSKPLTIKATKLFNYLCSDECSIPIAFFNSSMQHIKIIITTADSNNIFYLTPYIRKTHPDFAELDTNTNLIEFKKTLEFDYHINNFKLNKYLIYSLINSDFNGVIKPSTICFYEPICSIILKNNTQYINVLNQNFFKLTKFQIYNIQPHLMYDYSSFQFSITDKAYNLIEKSLSSNIKSDLNNNNSNNRHLGVIFLSSATIPPFLGLTFNILTSMYSSDSIYMNSTSSSPNDINSVDSTVINKSRSYSENQNNVDSTVIKKSRSSSFSSSSSNETVSSSFSNETVSSSSSNDQTVSNNILCSILKSNTFIILSLGTTTAYIFYVLYKKYKTLNSHSPIDEENDNNMNDTLNYPANDEQF